VLVVAPGQAVLIGTNAADLSPVVTQAELNARLVALETKLTASCRAMFEANQAEIVNVTEHAVEVDVRIDL
jgi:hypothetical protein